MPTASRRRRTWLIRFDFPETTMWAGWANDSLGYAPSENTAATFLTKEIARRHLNGSYGVESRKYGAVVEVTR